jgi:hypothetical protein
LKENEATSAISPVLMETTKNKEKERTKMSLIKMMKCFKRKNQDLLPLN